MDEKWLLNGGSRGVDDKLMRMIITFVYRNLDVIIMLDDENSVYR